MAQTRAERLAYARGYNRARARSSDLWRRLADIARGYRQRLAEPAMTHTCGGCSRWTRGHESALWGYCRADFDGHEPRMWPDRRDSQRLPDGACIVTQAEFGCINWLPADQTAESDEGTRI